MSGISNSASSPLTACSPTEQDSGPGELISDSIATGLAFALILTVGQRVIGFGRGVLFCRLMTDQELGQWSMIFSYLMLLAPLAVLGLPGCFGKYCEHYRQRGQLMTFIRRVAAVSATMTALMIGAIWCFPRQVSWMLFRDPAQANLVAWIAVALVFVTASNFLTSLMESLRQVRAVTLMRLITGVVFAVGGVGLLWVTSWGAGAATVGFAIACVAGILPGAWVLFKYRDGLANTGDVLTHATMWKKIAPFAAWMWASNLLINLFEVSDRYMLIHWSATTAEMAQSAVGQYHSGRVVPLLLVNVAAVLGGVLMPYMSEAWESNQRHRACRQLNWTVKLVSLFFTAGGVIVLLMSPILFDWILDGRYNEGLAVLPMTLVYCIWFSLHTVGQDYLWVAEKGKWAAIATAVGLVLNIGLNMVLIPSLGLQGAVLATAGGNLIIVVTLFAMNHRWGCSTDLGIWLSPAIPVLILGGPWIATLGLLFLTAACVMTNWIFSQEEKSDLWRIVDQRLVSRLR